MKALFDHEIDQIIWLASTEIEKCSGLGYSVNVGHCSEFSHPTSTDTDLAYVVEWRILLEPILLG
jgi:hypothetical protein